MNTQKVSVSAVIFNDQNEILLVKRSFNDDFLPGVWEMPGGGIDFGEEPEDAVVREVKEETGLSIDTTSSSIISVFSYFHPQTVWHVELIYLCNLHKESQVILSFEHTEYLWVKIEELQKVELSDLMKKNILVVFEHPLVRALIVKQNK